jgi:hypothetical protein
MEELNTTEEVLALGTCIGRNQALNLIANRCSAAAAETLRDIRDNKRYRALGLTWDEFCQHQGISRTYADRVLRWLEELGPSYFKLNSFTRISAAEYRKIAGAVTEDGLTYAGETIALESGNAPKLAGAVDALRREQAALQPPADPFEQALSKADRALQSAFLEFQRLQDMNLDEDGRLKLVLAIEAGRNLLDHMCLSAAL